MLHIISQNLLNAQCFLIRPNIIIKPGLAVNLQFSPIDNKYYVILSDGFNPIGILESSRNGIASVWIGTDKSFVAEVDDFDYQTTFNIGDLLYINKYGLLTNKRTTPSSIGKVIQPNSIKQTLIFEWSKDTRPRAQLGQLKDSNLVENKSNIKLGKNNGMSCIKCKIFNIYAESNMSDGTFKCWSCKN